MNNPPIPLEPNSESQATLEFGREAVREGEAFLKAQKGYDKIQKVIDAIMNEEGERDARPTWFSSTKDNRLGKIAEEQAAMCTDIKPFWEYTTQNPKYQQQAKNFGGLSLHWWLQRQADQRFMEVIKMALVGGSAWAYQHYDPNTEDIGLNAEDPRDVFPIRPASNGATIQEAEGVIMRRERTVNYMRALFPDKAYLIQADRDGSVQGAVESRFSRMFSWVNSAFHQRLMEGNEPVQRIPKVPTLDVYTMYLRDDRRNDTGHPIAMGPFSPDGGPLTNWSYIVMPGEKMYPRKRCITFTNKGVLRDGPSIYWHGMFPLSKLTPVSWPFSTCSWLGKGVLWDLLPLQKTLDRLLRGFDDHFEKVFRPDLIGDANSMSKAEMDKIDTRKAGLHIRHKMLGGSKGFSLEYPNPLESFLFEYVKFIISEMNEVSGTTDMANLTRLNQMPSSNTVEKILDSMSFAVKGRSRVIESFMREFATMLAYNFSQFYTLEMIVAILGEEGRTPQDMDFDPGTFIPDFVHGSDFDQLGEVTYEARLRGPLPRYDRAQEFLKQFEFKVQPSSLLAASEIEQKLMYLQLARGGLIDSQTLLEKLQIPNVQQIMERKMNEQMMGMGMQVSPAGRKSSGQEMPRIVMKES